jgi:hypothetical protein
MSFYSACLKSQSESSNLDILKSSIHNNFYSIFGQSVSTYMSQVRFFNVFRNATADYERHPLEFVAMVKDEEHKIVAVLNTPHCTRRLHCGLVWQ